MMVMRRRRPVMRAAMMGGAGYYAGKKRQEGRQDDAYRDARLDELESQQAAGPAPAAPAGAVPDSTIETLKQLAQLHDQGVLTDDEFAAQKSKLLGTV